MRADKYHGGVPTDRPAKLVRTCESGPPVESDRWTLIVMWLRAWLYATTPMQSHQRRRNAAIARRVRELRTGERRWGIADFLAGVPRLVVHRESRFRWLWTVCAALLVGATAFGLQMGDVPGYTQIGNTTGAFQGTVQTPLLEDQETLTPIFESTGAPWVTVSPIGQATGAASFNNGADFGPDTPGTTTSGSQEAINSLTYIAGIKDQSNAVVGGYTGRVIWLAGVFDMTTPITSPAGTLIFEGIGRSTYNYPMTIANPYVNYGGTQIVCANAAWGASQGGVFLIPYTANSVPGTRCVMRNMELRAVSPASGTPYNSHPILDLEGISHGEVTNVTVAEIATAGGVGTNVYNPINCYRSGDTDELWLNNIYVMGGGNQGISFGGPHIHADNIMVNSCGGNAFDISPSPQQFFSNLHAYNYTYNGVNYHGVAGYTTVIDGIFFESNSSANYITSSATAGVLILNNPVWQGGTDPSVNINANVSSGVSIRAANETDATGLYTPARNNLLSLPQVVVTANAGTVYSTAVEAKFTNSSAATMAITLNTAGALDGQILTVRVYDFSAAAETIGWTGTENGGASVPTTSNGSTTLPKTVTFMFNAATTKWRCIASA